MAQQKPRPKGGGRYTESQFFSFIRSGLRSKFHRWPPKWDTLEKAKIKSRAKRYKWKYKCEICKKYYPKKEVQVDHIIPCGSLKSFDELPQFVERLFCEENELRVLCKPCHTKVTKEERDAKNK